MRCRYGGERVGHADLAAPGPEHERVRVVQTRPSGEHLCAIPELFGHRRAAVLHECCVGAVAQLEIAGVHQSSFQRDRVSGTRGHDEKDRSGQQHRRTVHTRHPAAEVEGTEHVQARIEDAGHDCQRNSSHAQSSHAAESEWRRQRNRTMATTSPVNQVVKVKVGTARNGKRARMARAAGL